MALLCINVTAADLRSGLGYRLRAAIDIVNALCACRDFAPHRNGRFWRHAVSTLWIEYAARQALTKDPQREGGFLFQPSAHYMLPFGESAFSLFTVESEKYPPTRLEASLAELWRQIAWTDVMVKCPRAVIEEYAVHPVRTLQLEMKIPDNMNYVDRGDSERQRTTPGVELAPLRAALEDCVHPSTSAMATRGNRAASLNTPHVISISNRQNRGFRWRFALCTTNLRTIWEIQQDDACDVIRILAVLVTLFDTVVGCTYDVHDPASADSFEKSHPTLARWRSVQLPPRRFPCLPPLSIPQQPGVTRSVERV